MDINKSPTLLLLLETHLCVFYFHKKSLDSVFSFLFWGVKALGGCHASVHIHPEGRFEKPEEV